MTSSFRKSTAALADALRHRPKAVSVATVATLSIIETKEIS